MLCSVLSLPRHRLPICNFQENKSQCKENRQACNRHIDRSACQFYSCNNCRTEERWLLCLPTSYPFLLKVHLQEVYRTLRAPLPLSNRQHRFHILFLPEYPGCAFHLLFWEVLSLCCSCIFRPLRRLNTVQIFLGLPVGYLAEILMPLFFFGIDISIHKFLAEYLTQKIVFF